MEKPMGVKVVAVLLILGGALGVLLGLVQVLFGAALGGNILGGLTAIFGIISIIFGAAAAFIGWSVWQLKPWSRMVATVLGVLSLLGIPIGTIIGAVILYYLWMDVETKKAFGVS